MLDSNGDQIAVFCSFEADCSAGAVDDTKKR